jgi:hypothetical protein
MKPAAARGSSPFSPAFLGRLKVLDYFVFFVAFAAFCGSALLVYGGAAEAAQVSVNGRGGDWLYPLDMPETITVRGPLGDTVVAIDSGGARIVSSPCRNQTCVASPPVHRRGQWAACLPNQVMVSIEGGGASSGGRAENRIDGISW